MPKQFLPVLLLCASLTALQAASTDDTIKKASTFCPIARTFVHYDSDKDAHISAKELATCCASQNKKGPEVRAYMKSARGMIKAIDSNDDQLVSKVEYIAMLRKMNARSKKQAAVRKKGEEAKTKEAAEKKKVEKESKDEKAKDEKN